MVNLPSGTPIEEKPDNNSESTDSSESSPNEFQAILRLMLEREGIDLRYYRPSTIKRRITSRVQKLLIKDYAEYISRLAEDPSESKHLLDHLTIKVSRFFRDTAVFTRLREEVIPDILSHKAPHSRLNIWSAGCAKGEEAYSLAIILEEMKTKMQNMPEFLILGTDIDETAIAFSQLGIYPGESLTEVQSEIKETYFNQKTGRFGPQFEVEPKLRTNMKFLQHDLLSASMAPDDLAFDLVLCRNVVIYFERAGQERAYNLLTKSVNSGGFLCLGEAEQLPKKYLVDFETYDRKSRLYRKLRLSPHRSSADDS